MGVTAALMLLADGATPVKGLKKPLMLLPSLRGSSTPIDGCGGMCIVAAPSLSTARKYSLNGSLQYDQSVSINQPSGIECDNSHADLAIQDTNLQTCV